ncbi:hypothetical protein HUU61_18395 [Rhodopseudomonas palustris]|nr:hypothetical protein [Rhodopseudomonas palustris]
MPMTVSAEMWLRFSADNAVVCDNRRKIASTMITVAVDDQAESIAPTTSIALVMILVSACPDRDSDLIAVLASDRS